MKQKFCLIWYLANSLLLNISVTNISKRLIIHEMVKWHLLFRMSFLIFYWQRRIFVYFLLSLAMGSVYSNYYSLNFIFYIFGKRVSVDLNVNWNILTSFIGQGNAKKFFITELDIERLQDKFLYNYTFIYIGYSFYYLHTFVTINLGLYYLYYLSLSLSISLALRRAPIRGRNFCQKYKI